MVEQARRGEVRLRLRRSITVRESCLLDLHTTAPAQLRAWLEAPTKIRVIGPDYVRERDRDHVMVGGSLAEWFDVMLHTRTATPLRQLDPERARSW
jgi:erythromycin esterase